MELPFVGYNRAKKQKRRPLIRRIMQNAQLLKRDARLYISNNKAGICTHCGRFSRNLTACTIECEESEKLCFACLRNSGYCIGCGQFRAGEKSFDFSEIPGYCEHCVDQIKSDCWDSDEYEDMYEYDGNYYEQ